MAEIINFNTPNPEPGFYRGLEMPPGVMHWLSQHPPGSNFAVFADPTTGLLAGLVRADVLDLFIAASKKERK